MNINSITSIISFAIEELIPQIEILPDYSTIKLTDEYSCLNITVVGEDYSVVVVDSHTGEVRRSYGIVSEQTALDIIDGWM